MLWPGAGAGTIWVRKVVAGAAPSQQNAAMQYFYPVRDTRPLATRKRSGIRHIGPTSGELVQMKKDLLAATLAIALGLVPVVANAQEASTTAPAGAGSAAGAGASGVAVGSLTTVAVVGAVAVAGVVAAAASGGNDDEPDNGGGTTPTTTPTSTSTSTSTSTATSTAR